MDQIFFEEILKEKRNACCGYYCQQIWRTFLEALQCSWLLKAVFGPEVHEENKIFQQFKIKLDRVKTSNAMNLSNQSVGEMSRFSFICRRTNIRAWRSA